jgi:uncharacterized protein (TIGR00296 family)
MLTNKQGAQLLKFSTQVISSKFTNKALSKPKDMVFKEHMGAFVTLKMGAELRGCIGFPEPVLPLIDAIERAAIAAAFEDPRFPPLDESELKHIEIELSVLTKPKLLEVTSPKEYLKNICIGKDGLIVRHYPYSGLLLPQVATEHRMDVQGFLSQTCMKAGLAPDAWLDKGTKVYTFQCQIFNK